MKLGQRGSLSFALYFVVLFTTLLFAFALISPTLQNVTTSVYASNEFLIDDTNALAATIVLA